MNDYAQWGILFLLLLIISPLIFWIVSLLITWVKWLSKGKKELNQSYAMMNDFKNPVSNTITVNVELGTKSDNLSVKLLDKGFNEIKLLHHNDNVFLHVMLVRNKKYIHLSIHHSGDRPIQRTLVYLAGSVQTGVVFVDVLQLLEDLVSLVAFFSTD